MVPVVSWFQRPSPHARIAALELALRESESFAKYQRERALAAESQQADCMNALRRLESDHVGLIWKVAGLADKLESCSRTMLFAVEGNAARMDIVRKLRGLIA